MKLIILIGGNGSNLQAIIDAVQNQGLDLQLTAVISHRPGVYGLERAAKASIPAMCIDHQAYASRAEFEAALHAALLAYEPDYIALAGFMRILSGAFVARWPNKILNIHPSLLPHYQGLNTHQRVLDAGEKTHGATVHFVTEHLDAGPIISQAAIDVFADDTADTLKQRVQQIEHQLYPAALTLITTEYSLKTRPYYYAQTT